MTQNIRMSNKEKVLNFLKKNKKNRYMIKEISQQVDLDRHTVSKYLQEYLMEDRVKTYSIGLYKLWSYKRQEVKQWKTNH